MEPRNLPSFGGSARLPPARKQVGSGCFLPAAPFSPPALHYIRIVNNARRGRPILRDISGKESSWPSFRATDGRWTVSIVSPRGEGCVDTSRLKRPAGRGLSMFG
jgi:hypothetical protein